MDDCLTELGWPEPDRFDLLLAVDEAVSNACEHAYPDAAPGPVFIRTHMLGGPAGQYRMSVTVADRGSWQEPEQARPSKTSGFALMRAVTDHLEVQGNIAGTRVSMISRPVALTPLVAEMSA